MDCISSVGSSGKTVKNLPQKDNQKLWVKPCEERRALKSHKEDLSEVEQKYGVPFKIIPGIILRQIKGLIIWR